MSALIPTIPIHPLSHATAAPRYGGPRLISRLGTRLPEADLTAADLARLADVSYSLVLRLVRGEADPRLDDALRIAELLELPVEELFELEGRGPVAIRPPGIAP